MLSLLFSIGIIILVFKLVAFSLKASLSLAMAILCVAGLPIILIALFIYGLVYLSVPLLLIALVIVFLSGLNRSNK